MDLSQTVGLPVGLLPPVGQGRKPPAFTMNYLTYIDLAVLAITFSAKVPKHIQDVLGRPLLRVKAGTTQKEAAARVELLAVTDAIFENAGVGRVLPSMDMGLGMHQAPVN